MRGLCFFAHYDRDNVIAPHVVHYLSALAQAGFTTTLITTSNLPADECAKAAPFCQGGVIGYGGVERRPTTPCMVPPLTLFRGRLPHYSTHERGRMSAHLANVS